MLKYVLELKNRFILLLLNGFSIVLVGYIYKEILLFLFLESEILNNGEFKVDYFIFTDIAEVFYVYINLIIFITVQILFLYFLYHTFIFFSYGLYVSEYYYLKFITKVFLIVWFLSIFLSKYIFIPLMWKFFISFQIESSINFYFEAKLSEYLNFYIQFYYMFIFYCQIFTILFLFMNYSNANILYIRQYRKLYYYFFLVFSTLISPPDVYNQIFISFVSIFCYEMFIFNLVIKFVIKDLIR